jgi:dTDP-4-amino-4,6-dideoxygalactose transaminase
VPAAADVTHNKIKDIAFHVPHRAAGEAANIAEVLSSSRLMSGGKFSTAVEARMASLTGAEKVYLTHSCTGAMEAALLALGIGPGDEVIVPTFTFAATATAVLRTGAKPVLCDVDALSLMVDISHVEARLTARTKAIMVVHYGGAIADMAPIVQLAGRKGIAILEDAAQGLGATRDGRHAGTFGMFGAISFHDTKVAGCGHGGALLCNTGDAKLMRRLEQILNRGTDFADKLAGRVSYYQWVSQGSHLRLGELEAAVIAAQLDELPSNLARRREIAQEYAARLGDACNTWRFVAGNTAAGSNHHIFGLLAQSPDIAAMLLRQARKAGIQVETHYAPLHVSPFARQSGLDRPDCPGGASVWSKLVRLHVHTSMSLDDVLRVTDFLAGFAGKHEKSGRASQLAG